MHFAEPTSHSRQTPASPVRWRTHASNSARACDLQPTLQRVSHVNAFNLAFPRERHSCWAHLKFAFPRERRSLHLRRCTKPRQTHRYPYPPKLHRRQRALLSPHAPLAGFLGRRHRADHRVAARTPNHTTMNAAPSYLKARPTSGRARACWRSSPNPVAMESVWRNFHSVEEPMRSGIVVHAGSQARSRDF